MRRSLFFIAAMLFAANFALFADLDATWGKGFFNGDVFAQVVYSAL
jgi:hypothetical protein